MEIWAERPHFSEVSGRYLGEMPMSYYFSHVLSRGAYPELSHDKRNIVLMTLDEHQLWEFGSVPKNDKNWDKILKLKESLKQK
jgi:hypothetical protein